MHTFRRRPFALALAVPLTVVAGLDSGDPAAAADHQPSELERAVHVLTNAARQSPMDWCELCSDSCESYPQEARPSVTYGERLAAAARFHARHMHDAPCYQHDSCCTLEWTGETAECVSPPGACATCTPGTACPGTSARDRVQLFGDGAYNGENVGASVTAAEDALCMWLKSPGHRANIFHPTHTRLGVGHFAGPSCAGDYWVQDFGRGPAGSDVIAVASVVDDQYFAATIRHDASPESANVVVDGVCKALALRWGNVTDGTWTRDLDTGISGDCHAYYFVVVDAQGNVHSYPESGSLGYGGADCEEIVDERAQADCLPLTCETDEVCGDSTDNDCDGAVDEGCESSSPDAGMDPDPPDPEMPQASGCTTHSGGSLSGVLLVVLACVHQRRRTGRAKRPRSQTN